MGTAYQSRQEVGTDWGDHTVAAPPLPARLTFLPRDLLDCQVQTPREAFPIAVEPLLTFIIFFFSYSWRVYDPVLH